jgi:ankyrin repeat protein
MNEEVLDALVAHGADIETRSGAGVTPLMVAWQSRRADLASALIAAGADQDAWNMYGDTVAEYRAHFAGDRAQSDIAAVKHLAFGAAQIATDPITLCERPAG